MKDYSTDPNLSRRQMVVRWVFDGTLVRQVQGFYCTNGPDVDGEWNIYDADGKEAPGPASRSPFYFFPEAGCSTGLNSTFDTEFDATNAALRKAEEEYAAAASRVADLRTRQRALMP